MIRTTTKIYCDECQEDYPSESYHGVKTLIIGEYIDLEKDIKDFHCCKECFEPFKQYIEIEEKGKFIRYKKIEINSLEFYELITNGEENI